MAIKIEFRIGTLLYKSIGDDKIEILRIVDITKDKVIKCVTSITNFKEVIKVDYDTLYTNYNCIKPLYVLSYVETLAGDSYIMLRLNMEEKVPELIIDHTRKTTICPARDKFNIRILRRENIRTVEKYSMYCFDNIVEVMSTVFKSENSNRSSDILKDSEMDKYIYEEFSIQFIDTEVDMSNRDKRVIEEFTLFMKLSDKFGIVNTVNNTFIIK